MCIRDREGIGTDATYQDHIAKIMERKYIVQENNYFKPTPLGLALNDGYEGMGFDFMKPRLRAEMEQGLQDISSGRQTYDAVRNNFIKQYRDAYVTAERMYDVLTREFTRQKNNPYNAPLPVEEQASKRSKSKSDGKTKKKKSSSSKSTKSSKTSKSSKSSKSSKTATTTTRKPWKSKPKKRQKSDFSDNLSSQFYFLTRNAYNFNSTSPRILIR